jgi:hypothetical protein
MIINSSRKKEYRMVKADQFAPEVIGLNELKTLVLSTFPDDVPLPHKDKLEFGYVEPGHGLKGKKEWILDEDDVKAFLDKYRGKINKEFTLWCYSRGPESNKPSKRPRSPTTKSSRQGSSRYDAHIEKMAEVDKVYEKIHEKHGSQYSAEQKRAWAHMIQLGSHDSVSQPPQKRFFKCPPGSKESGSPSGNTAGALVASPGRGRINIRSECIDQLQKWHALLDCGAITKDQYEELQSTILSDIKKL